MVFIKKYSQFVLAQYRSFVFICLFYAAKFVYQFVEKANFSLTSLSGRMIGIATLQGFDIHHRILVFYQALFLIVISSVAISLFIYILYKKRIQNLHNEMQVFNATSLIGLFFLFFSIYGENIDSLISFIFYIQAFWGLFILLKKKDSNDFFSIYIFAALICIAISAPFFLKEIGIFFTIEFKLNFLPLFLFCGVLTIFFWALFFRNRTKEIILKWLWIAAPLTLIPILSVFDKEFYLILNNKNIFYLTPNKIYSLLLFFLMLWIVFRMYFFSRKRNTAAFDFKYILSKIYFPFSIISLATFLMYQPFTNPSSEMFELANRTLPIMEMIRFGTIPVIQKFNSHMLSEIFSGLLYTFINGYSGQSFVIYDFIFLSVAVLITYYFILYFTENPFIAVFFVLFFPLSPQLFPEHFIMCLLAFFVFRKLLIASASIKKYTALFAIVAFLLVWQIDLGYSVLWAIAVIFLFYAFAEKEYGFKKYFFIKSLLITISGVLLLLLLFLFRGINLIESFKNILNYFSSAQSYGTVNMGNLYLSSYKMQYFIFPFLCVILLGYYTINFQKYCSKENTKISLYALLFLMILYFVNFQRGLVRHSFLEGIDYPLSSFIFLIFSGSSYLFFQNKSPILKFLLFTGVSCFLILNYNFPTLTAENFNSPFSEIIQKADTISPLKPVSKIINRCPMNNEFKKNIFSDFSNFTDKNLSPNQTFLDFSNSPMLYFYTEKITPGFFNQNTLSLQNDYLQENFLKGLKKYDVPFVVYSNFPESYWDHVDDVPNALRHYKVAEYIFQHYTPFVIVQNHCIWKKNSDADSNNPTDTLLLNFGKTQLKLDSLNKIFTLQKNNLSEDKYLFKIKYDVLDDADSCLYYSKILENSSFTNRIKCVDVNTLQKIRYFIVDSMTSKKYFFSTKNISQVEIFSSPFIPDFYSQQAKTYNLLELPYIWANSNSSLASQNPIAVLLSEEKSINNNNSIRCTLPENVNRSDGNYIFITTNSSAKNPITMQLTYGKNTSISGSFLFTIPSENTTDKKFAIRISTQFNWYAIKNNWIKLETLNADSNVIKIKKIALLKGD